MRVQFLNFRRWLERQISYPNIRRRFVIRLDAAGLTYCRYRTFQRFCNYPMSVINDRLRVQTYAYRACEYISTFMRGTRL